MREHPTVRDMTRTRIHKKTAMKTAQKTLGWGERVSAAATALGLDVGAVTAKLSQWGIDEQQMGVAALDDDDVTKFGDFVTFFGRSEDGSSVPQAKLRLAFKFLKGGTKAEDRTGLDARTVELRSRFGVKPSLETASLEQLVEYYDPIKIGDPVTAALKKRFGEIPVVAFKPESNSVDNSATLSFMADLEAGIIDETVTTVMSEGRLVKLHPVGVLPNVVLDEDPLYPGKPLRNGRSISNHRDWSNVSTEARQFCALAVAMDKVTVSDAHSVVALITAAEKGQRQLADLYPEVDLEFRARKLAGTLPNLKLVIVSMNLTRPSNPFGIGKPNRQC